MVRWDIRVIDALPNYMKVCYKALLDVYTEVEEELAKERKLYLIHYAREAVSSIHPLRLSTDTHIHSYTHSLIYGKRKTFLFSEKL